jgi:hypothetical protein
MDGWKDSQKMDDEMNGWKASQKKTMTSFNICNLLPFLIKKPPLYNYLTLFPYPPTWI